MPSCLDSLPSSLEPTYSCATEIVQAGPVAALLIIVIGVPLIKLAKRYLQRLFDRTDTLDESIENFIFRIAGVAMWAIVLLTAANELGINVTGIVAALGIIGLAVAFASQDTMRISSLAFSLLLTDRFGKENVSCCPRKSGVSTAAGVT